LKEKEGVSPQSGGRGFQDPRQERNPRAHPVLANGNRKVMGTLGLS